MMSCSILLQVTWYQDSFLVAPTERRYVETRGNKHILTIKELQPSDFGNYSCVADNSLGKNKKFMELSGMTTNGFLHIFYPQNHFSFLPSSYSASFFSYLLFFFP